jgi:peptidoglycan/LPS O-acetylase OafA/YrhL
MRFSPDIPGRYTEFDGVRGVAIFLTIACNTIIAWGPGLDDKIWNVLASAGWIGVQIFFVLSGFLITGILLDSKGDRYYFFNFYARRALRILPLYFLVLALITCAVKFYGESIPLHPLCYWLFVSNFCIAQSGQWIDGYLGITWSLAVEEQFYLVWPFIIALLPSRWLIPATCLVIASSLLLRYAMVAHGGLSLSLYTMTFTRIDGLAAGALAAIFLQQPTKAGTLLRLGRRLLAIGLALMAATALPAQSFSYEHPLVETSGYTALTIAATGFILTLAAEPEARHPLRRAMRWGPLATVGFYSYAIYLLHAIAAFVVGRLSPFQPEALQDFPGGILAAQLAFTAIVTVVSFALAVGCYHLFEKRFLNLRRYFPRRTSRDVLLSNSILHVRHADANSS